MRIPGSGCVSAVDLEVAWGPLVSESLVQMMSTKNERIGGRGFLDCRQQQSKTHPLHIPHGSAMVTAGDTQVMSSATVSVIRAADVGNEEARFAVRQDSLNLPANQVIVLSIRL